MSVPTGFIAMVSRSMPAPSVERPPSTQLPDSTAS